MRHKSICAYLVFAACCFGGHVESARADWVAGRDMALNEKPDGSPNETTNPNPTVPEWSYGHRVDTTPVPALTLFTSADHFNNTAFGVDGYHLTNATTTPEVSVNTTGGDVTITAGHVLASHEMYMHPGGGDHQYAIARWTAPAAGTYSLSAAWRDLDANGGDGAAGIVLLNGVAIFNQAFANGGNTSYANSSITLAFHDLLDFATGEGAGGNFGFDATALNATITAVPEPSSLGLLISPLVLLLRRKNSLGCKRS